ncbi:hypothetical protein B0H14DRAFT_2740279 [Mycena olivaceomarginata]|nr:hypothetical protein B0H14DRAFT_2740279 [Mycena olivaceomarginata]
MATRLISVLPAISPDPELFGAEVSGLLANYAALQDYSHRPDCFRNVAGKIERRCGTLEMDNDARVEGTPPSKITNLVRAITAREKADLTGKKLWDIQLSELANVAGVTPRFEHELTRIVKEFKADLQEAQTRKQSHTADQIGSDLQLILKEVDYIFTYFPLFQAYCYRMRNSLDNLAPLLEKFLADNLNDAISSFQTQSLQNLQFNCKDMWTNLTLQFSTMRQASVGLAQEMREAQSSASISASNLGEALTRMTTTTYESLERINASAGMITESLNLAAVVSRIDLRHVPIFGMVSALLGFFLYLFRSICSVLMSLTLLLFQPRNNTNERDNAATLGTAELLKLCQTLEKVCVSKGDPAQNMELSNALRIVRRHVSEGRCRIQNS